MKRRLGILTTIFLLTSAAAEGPWTLERCFQSALKHSETLAISEEAVRRAEAQYRQVVGRSLPEASFQYSALWQDQSGLGDLGSVGGSFAASPSEEGAFRLKQSLFTGYRELAAIRAGGSLVQQRAQERNRVELALFNDVASSYYAVLLADANQDTTQKSLALAQERLQELRSRESVGRSRRAEALDVEAEIAVLKAQAEETRRTVRAARNLLGFLVGAPVDGPLEERWDSEKPSGLEAYLRRARARPDLRAKEEAISVAVGAVRNARAAHFPGLDLTANYYTKRTGFRNAIDWDAGLGVTVPLWSWGATRETVREAEASLRQAQLEAQQAQEQVDLEVHDAYEEAVSAITRASLQQEALGLARRSYESRTADYRRGLVTNFEVLEALNRLHRTQFAVHSARFQAALSALQLTTAAGALPLSL